MPETKLTGTLPTMSVEITHRTAPDGSAEHMTIEVTATPGFDAMLPLLTQMPLMLAGMNNPTTFWPMADWAQAWLAPWTALARANPFLPPQIAHFLGSDKN